MLETPGPLPPSKSLVMAASPGREWSLDDPLDMSAVFAVCEQVAFGRTLREIEQEPGMPPRGLFMLWVMQHGAVANTYMRARELSAYALEDDALELFRTPPGDQLELRWREAKASNLWRSASRRNPQIFSEKAAVNVTVPIQINTSLDLGEAAVGTSTREFPNIYELKSDVQQVVAIPTDPMKARVDPDTGKLRPARKRVGGKLMKVVKPRGAETVAAREARQEAEAYLQQQLERRRMWRNTKVAEQRANEQSKKGKRRGKRKSADTE